MLQVLGEFIKFEILANQGGDYTLRVFSPGCVSARVTELELFYDYIEQRSVWAELKFKFTIDKIAWAETTKSLLHHTC